jgi:uncharacterized protein (UPF0276 family)
MFDALADANLDAIDFMEVGPENWIRVGGRFGRRFREFSERFPIVCHGLSLSLGSPSPLDLEFLREVNAFLERFNIDCYTEHLSYCSDHGHLYDLMPIPFTEEAVGFVAERIRQVQGVLDRQIGVEHVSYYAAPGREMSELEFINAVVEQADCGLLLDVNNIYVNSINHGYDPLDFLAGLPGKRVMYVHIAGHYVEAPDLRVDSHGSDVIEPVWSLLDEAYARFGVMPTLLERDFNFPPVERLLGEVERIKSAQERALAFSAAS